MIMKKRAEETNEKVRETFHKNRRRKMMKQPRSLKQRQTTLKEAFGNHIESIDEYLFGDDKISFLGKIEW